MGFTGKKATKSRVEKTKKKKNEKKMKNEKKNFFWFCDFRIFIC